MFDVTTIGTATRDTTVKSPLFKVLRDAKHLRKLGFTTGEAQCFAFGEKLEVDAPIFTIGGGAANAGVTFARQGLKTAVLASVGDDLNARDIRNDLVNEGTTPFLIKDKCAETAYSVILLSPDGERTVLHYRGASKNLRYGDIPSSVLRTRVGYIAPGDIPFPVMMRIIRKLRRAAECIVMNPSAHYLERGIKDISPMLRLLDVVIMNREEASYLTGCRYDDTRAIFRKACALTKGIVVVTDGPRGVLVSDHARIYRAGVYPEKKILDRLGAGDAFGSGFVAGLVMKSSAKNQQEKIAYAIRLGSANATSVVEHIGAQTGILKNREFEHEKRWRCLAIRESPMRQS